MGSRKMTVAALAAVLVVAAAQAAFADSGSFREVRSFHHQYVTVDHGGETFTGGILRGTVTIVDSTGGPFVAGTNRPSDCLVFSHSSDDGIALQAPCTSTDADGDIMYSRALRRHGDVDVRGGGEGVWEIRGGTGKFAGISGSCSYTTEYLEGSRVAVLSECAWSRS